MQLGPTELILIIVIVVIFFGVGRLPEVFGSVGKGLREFRSAVKEEEEAGKPAKPVAVRESSEPVDTPSVEEQPVETAETEETQLEKQP